MDRNYQTDLWHHLARGRVLIEEGVLLNSDRFTYTVSDEPFRDVNWGWQAAFYLLYRVGGISLVQLANSAILALTFGLLGALASRKCRSPVIAAIACVTAFLGLWPLLIIRPQTFSLLLFVGLQCILNAAAHRTAWLVAAPLVMASWVNVHGGFPIGLVLIAANGVAVTAEAALKAASQRLLTCLRASTPFWICLAVSALATLANPYGWHVYEYVGLTSARASTRHIDEWLPPGLDSLTGKMFAISIAASVLLLALARKKPILRDAIVACCFLPLACGSVRMVAWWFLAWTPFFAELLEAACPQLTEADAGDNDSSRSAAFSCVLLIAAAIFSLPYLERMNPVFLLPGRAHRTESDLQEAVDQIARHAQGRVFTRFAWGEYVEWALDGRGSVFMDGRIEIYPDEVWDQYAAITRGRADWQQLLDSYGVDCLLLDDSGYDGQLIAFVSKSNAWNEVFRKGNAVLFLRNSSVENIGPLTRRAMPPNLRAEAGN
jgi:hypothetical protein